MIKKSLRGKKLRKNEKMKYNKKKLKRNLLETEFTRDWNKMLLNFEKKRIMHEPKLERISV